MKPESLKRVTVQEDPNQSEAAVWHIDINNRADLAVLTINPELVDAEGVDGYRIRAGMAATLEGFRRYRRRIISRFGALDSDELLFRQAMERAESELEQLVHLAPRGKPTVAQAKAQLKAWLEDDRLRAALEPLLTPPAIPEAAPTGGDDGQREPQLESPEAGAGTDGASTQASGRRPRRSAQ